MSWFDYLFVACALLLALFSNNVADAALRASVMMFLRASKEWTRTFDLRRVFGPFVYAALKRLHRDGVIERKETLAHDELRGGYASIWYRWKDPS